jgi:cytochrome P450
MDVMTGPGRANAIPREAFEAITDMMAYIRQAARQRRRQPGGDLISALVSASGGEEVLSDAEVVLFSIMLLIAGNETTTNLIGNTSLALLQNPSQLAMLETRPELIPAALEETLRYDAPVQMLFRVATRECKIAGTRIGKGDTLAILLGSANRDERQFKDPDRFDIGRNPQGHLGFGNGPHFCLGASLARLEARIALERLLPILAKQRPPSGPIERQDSFLVRGPFSLPLSSPDPESKAV